MLGKVGRLGRVSVEKSRKVEKGNVSRRNNTVGHKETPPYIFLFSGEMSGNFSFNPTSSSSISFVGTVDECQIRLHRGKFLGPIQCTRNLMPTVLHYFNV